ncbi:lipocalin-like domain-containing protein [Streptomyces platensis]|uniref:lipocalin-like domain-containing protein n=1 Tax=Streptomyces platensis TaxID=58346 RepID=UPI00367E59B2
MLSEKDLIGVWRLVSHFYLDEDGSMSDGPLGPGADGLLLYEANGYMAVGMMRTDHRSDGSASESDPPPAAYLGYTGRWRVAESQVIHEVAVGSHPRVVNTEQIRDARLNDGRLVLSRPVEGSAQLIAMEWRRA